MKRLLLISLSLSSLLVASSLNAKNFNTRITSLYSIDRMFFGHNPQFVDIMRNSDIQTLAKIEEEKYKALSNYKKEHSYSGLKVKFNADTELNHHRGGYDTKLSWDLLSGGYLGYQKDAQRDVVKEEIELNGLFLDTKTDFMKVAISEIDTIEESILYHYMRLRAGFLKNVVMKEKKRVSKGVLSIQSYEELNNIYKKVNNTISYYRSFQPETFDIGYRSFIKDIEHFPLNDLKTLTNYALVHDKTLKSLQLQVKNESSLGRKWEDRVRANVYVDRQKYTFLDRKDTKLGFNLSLPLDTPRDKNDLGKVKMALYNQKLKSRKELLKKNISYIYTKVNYHKNKIVSLKNEIRYYRSQLRHLNLKSKHPILSDEFDPIKESALKYLHIIDVDQSIWQERCEIIKNYITLQYLTGIKIL